MRKFFIIILAAAAALVSCSKMETASPENQDQTINNIKFEITVGDLPTGTKTTITTPDEWAIGDKISIWFDGNIYDPDLVLTYQGNGFWAQATNFISSGFAPKTEGGKLVAIYEGYNKLNTYDFDYDTNATYYRKNSSLGGNAYYFTPKVVAYLESYEFNGFDVVSASLHNHQYLTKIKVVVTGDGIDYSNKYTLECDGLKGLACFGPTTDCSVSVKKSSRVGGVADKDGLAFYFYDAESSATKDYLFILRRYNSTGGFIGVSSPEFYSKKISTQDKGLTVIPISKSRFGVL